MVLGFRMPQPIASRINNDGRGESVAYLRQLGALDESDPEAEGMPQVMATFNGTNLGGPYFQRDPIVNLLVHSVIE